MNNSLTNKCRVCGSESRYAFSQTVLARPVSYFDCATCGYLQTQMPDWLDEAYSSAISNYDTGIMMRNQQNVGRVFMTLFALGRLHGRIVDHAGGYGILVRMLRDIGVDASWRDKYCENLMAREFEAKEEGHDLLTAFEVFEHLVDPFLELTEMLRDSPAVLLSTELIASDATPSTDWWYYGPEHGQHIGFFRPATLRWMARKLGCYCASDGASLHLFSRTPIPRLWLLLIKLSRFTPFVARFCLSSKTMTDFDILRKVR